MEYDEEKVDAARDQSYPSNNDYMSVDGVLSKLSIDPTEIANEGRGIVVPSGTEIYVSHVTLSVPTKIYVFKENAFYLEVGASTNFIEHNSGLHESHPFVDLEDDKHQISTLSTSISTENRIYFPDVEDPDVVQNTAFVEGWIKHLKYDWEWERFAEREIDPFLRMDRRLDEIDEKLDVILKNQ